MSVDERAEAMAQRMADRAMSQRAQKSAGGAAASRDDWLKVCRPVAAAIWDGLAPVREAFDGRDGTLAAAAGMTEQIRAMAAADEQRRDFAAKAFGMSVRGAREPHQLVPFDPATMPLQAYLAGAREVPHVNGHGAQAPEGGQ